MNKIVKSLAVIAFVAAIAIGATSAYFSDEEKSTGNTMTAGTIDISLKGNGSVTNPYTIADIKPGETGYINYDISNDGTNPVNVSKNLSNFQESTGKNNVSCAGTSGVSSEPECVALNNGADINDLRNRIIYDLSVKVYEGSNTTPSWWQEIYNVNDNKTLAMVYPNDGQPSGTGPTYIALGMIPVGGHMVVTQSYHFDYNAGNEYQGDVLSFDVTFKGEQLTGANGTASVILEDKTAGPEYRIMTETAPKATLSYKTTGPLFDYNLTGVVNQAGGSYILLQANDPWPQTGSKVIATFTSDGSKNINISGTMDTGSIVNGKMWVILAADWSGTQMIAWNQPEYLLETGLVNYTK